MATGDAARIRAIRELLNKLEGRIGRAFLEGVESARSNLDLKHLQDLIAENRLDKAAEYVTSSLYGMGFFKLADAITQSVIDAGQLAARYAHVDNISVRFDILNPKTAEYLRNYTYGLIRQISVETRQVVANLMREGIAEGFNPRTIAIGIRDTIGLTGTQERAVANYRKLLQNLDPSALTRELRDKRYDPTIARAIREQQAIPDEKIDAMVDRYRDGYLNYRAESIARTEAIRANSTGNQELWQQAVDDGKVSVTDLKRFWINTKDGRTREAHLHIPLQNANGVGFNEPFKSDLGPILFPGDPNAEAANVINCVTGDTLISASDVLAISQREYDGEIFTIETASGYKLACTPNHPILTAMGWKAAHSINKSDQLVCYTGQDGVMIEWLDLKNVPTAAQQLFQSVQAISGRSAHRSEQIKMDFHGDGFTNGDVDIVLLASHLPSIPNAILVEDAAKPILQFTGVSNQGLPSKRPPTLALNTINASSPSGVSRSDLSLSSVLAHLRPFNSLGLALPAQANSVTEQETANGLAPDIKALRQTIDGMPGAVKLDNVVWVSRAPFKGHVYNLQTDTELYIGGGIVQHNCRCAVFTRITKN